MGGRIKRYARVVITYFMIAALALLLSGIIQSMLSAQSEFRGAISKNAIAIEVREYNGDVAGFCRTLADDSQCTAIYKVFPYANARAVWLRNPAEEPRPMLSGSFFDEEQLRSSDRLAVVGRNVFESNVEYLNQTPVIYFHTQAYEVVGVLGYSDRGSDYDDATYINLSSLSENGGYAADGEYILDYAAGSVDPFRAVLASVLPGQPAETTITQTAMNKYIPSIANVLEDDSVIDLLFISLLMVLLTSYSVTLEWIDKRKKEIAIRKQLGATTGRITVYLYSRFLAAALLAYAAALPLYAAYHSRIMDWLQYPSCAINLPETLLVYAACVAVSLLGCVPAIAAIKRILPQALVR